MENNNFQKEYAILCIFNRGKPFILSTFNSLIDAKNKLYELIEQEEIRNRVYYVDNDFYDNKYQIGLQAQKYFCIQEREITNWKKYEIGKVQETKYYNNNILIFRKNA